MFAGASSSGGHHDDLSDFERDAARAPAGRYALCLYVSGNTPRSNAAVANIKRICEEHLPGWYDLKVVDLYQQPRLAREQQLVAAPTLIKHRPEPVRRLVGDMSNEDRVLVGLDLRRIG